MEAVKWIKERFKKTITRNLLEERSMRQKLLNKYGKKYLSLYLMIKPNKPFITDLIYKCIQRPIK